MFFISSILPWPLLPMEQLSFSQLSTLRGQFSEPPPSTRIILTSGFEFLPDLITLVRKHYFFELESENPYTHLSDFERLCSFFDTQSMTQDTLKYDTGSIHVFWEWRCYFRHLSSSQQQSYSPVPHRANWIYFD